ncbi:MAG: cation:proton antiporter [Chloroflexota bacterium]
MLFLLGANVYIAPFFMELGLMILLVALAGRLALKFGLSPIPFYLIVGLFFSSEGFLPHQFSEEFVSLGAEIGVILLLFMLGLEYTSGELKSVLRTGIPAGAVDLVLNMTPGVIFGLLLGWHWVPSLLLGGVTYISSSGIISKLLGDLGWLGNRETPVILSLLVIEDLVMAIYLPLMAVLLIGSDWLTGAMSLGTAIITVVVVLTIALTQGERLSRWMDSSSNEILLLTILGVILLVAGATQHLQVSAAVGAFLVGIALSDPITEQTHHLIEPLKDLFATIFFVFFGLQITPSTIPPVLVTAFALVILTGFTKYLTGIYAAKRAGIGTNGQHRAASMLTIRGEFSIVIAGLATGSALDEPMLAPLAAAYVLIIALVGPILVRFIKPIQTRARNLLPARYRPQPTMTQETPSV